MFGVINLYKTAALQSVFLFTKVSEPANTWRSWNTKHLQCVLSLVNVGSADAPEPFVMKTEFIMLLNRQDGN